MVAFGERDRAEAHRNERDIVMQPHQRIGQRLNATAARRPVIVDAGNDHDVRLAAVRHGWRGALRFYSSRDNWGSCARLVLGSSARIAFSAGVSRRCILRLLEFIIEFHISGWMTAVPAGIGSAAYASR